MFPAESEREAVRIELFDDEIEKLAWFDPLTGEVQRQVPRLTIYPKTHYVTPREVMLRRRGPAFVRICANACLSCEAKGTSWWKPSVLSSAPMFDLEMINGNWATATALRTTAATCPGAEARRAAALPVRLPARRRVADHR